MTMVNTFIEDLQHDLTTIDGLIETQARFGEAYVARLTEKRGTVVRAIERAEFIRSNGADNDLAVFVDVRKAVQEEKTIAEWILNSDLDVTPMRRHELTGIVAGASHIMERLRTANHR